MKIQPDAMETAAEQASELLKSLANRHRLLILCQLVDGERSVGDLAAFLEDARLHGLPAPRAAAQGRPGAGAAGGADDLLLDRLLPGAAGAGDAVRDLLLTDADLRNASRRGQAETAGARQRPRPREISTEIK